MTAATTSITLRLAGLDVPAIEVTGARPGPRLTVIAGVHGCEYSSMAGLRGFVRDLDPERLSGTVVAVPVLNLPSFWARTPFVVPDDGKNLNRCFPGDPAGTLAERLAHDVFTQLIVGSDALVDMHAGDQVEALEPFALYDAGPQEAKSLALATAYGVGYVIRQDAGPDRAVSGSSSSAAAAAGIPAIIAEAGGCGLVTPEAVAAHRRGLGGVLAALGMQATADPTPAEPVFLERFLWLRCARGGWWTSEVEPGQRVSTGELLGTVTSLDGGEVIESIHAPAAGIPMFITTSPAVQDDGLLLGLGAPAAELAATA
jgi:predicted deacylase